MARLSHGLAILIMVCLLGSVVPLHAQGDPKATAQTVVDNLLAGDFEAVAAVFDDTMQAALPVEQLAETWQSVEAQVGAFQQQLAVYSYPADGFTRVVITLQFEAAIIDVEVNVGQAQDVVGLFVRPGQVPLPGAGELPAGVEEWEITLNTGTAWELPGIVTVPAGGGPFPAVVLVHGSGPNDRDETIGPNKPFRDIAYALASSGIATLRYDKRTFVHGQQMVDLDLTVREEVVDDALAAVALLHSMEDIDPDRVFVLGHSLGGYLLPHILENGQVDIRGGIILAGNARPLEVLIREQTQYLLALDGELSESDQQQLAATDQLVTAIQALEPDTPGLFFGAPASYWLDLRGYDPVATAQRVNLPLLILQGERDYQVTMTDFQLWQDGLASRDNVTLISYPDLNHLFLAGQGPSRPVEYEQPGQVVDSVISDIVRWINQY
ncbi:MAG: alpha/beta fold hydrolase [Chloroflexi bacterium]|nr:alpha/beta fold hydrolase [Chloroflexota bacterium]